MTMAMMMTAMTNEGGDGEEEEEAVRNGLGSMDVLGFSCFFPFCFSCLVSSVT